MDLDFRKKLTTYGITQEEYEAMTKEEQEKITKRIKTELKAEKISDVGKGLTGLGCLIILIPVAILLVVFIFTLLF